MLAAVGITLPTGLGLVAGIGAVILADNLLYYGAHWLDNLNSVVPQQMRGTLVGRLAGRAGGAALWAAAGFLLATAVGMVFPAAIPVVGGFLAGLSVPLLVAILFGLFGLAVSRDLGSGGKAANRLLGGGLAALIGVFLITNAFLILTNGGAMALLGGVPVIGGLLLGLALVVGVIVSIPIALVSLRATLSALLVYRYDEYNHGGWRGEGIRALTLIPGMLLQYPVVFVFKWAILMVKKWASQAPRVGGWAGLVVGFVIGLSLVLTGPGTTLGMAFVIVLKWILGISFLGYVAGKGLGAVNRYLVDIPWSADIYLFWIWQNIERRARGESWLRLGQFLGMVDHLVHQVVMGSAAIPGKLTGRPTVGWKGWTKMDASKMPLMALIFKANEPDWTAPVNWMIPNTADEYQLGLAEDSFQGWEWHEEGYVGEPIVPAIGAKDMDDAIAKHEEARDDGGSFERAFQFAKGAGMWLAIQRMRGGAQLTSLVQQARALPPDQRQKVFASVLWAIHHQDQADTGSRTGAGVYSFLFTSNTASQLGMRLISSLYSLGEPMALARFLYYMHRDQELGGALSKQLFQMNREQDGNPLRGLADNALPAGTLADQAVLEFLLGHGAVVPYTHIGETGGWAIDPRTALGAARTARGKGWFALKGMGEVVEVQSVLVRVIEGFWNKQVLKDIGSTERHMRVVDYLKSLGKGQFIRMKKEYLQEIKVVVQRDLGSDVSAKAVKAQRAEFRRRSEERAANAGRFNPNAGLEERNFRLRLEVLEDRVLPSAIVLNEPNSIEPVLDERPVLAETGIVLEVAVPDRPKGRTFTEFKRVDEAMSAGAVLDPEDVHQLSQWLHGVATTPGDVDLAIEAQARRSELQVRTRKEAVEQTEGFRGSSVTETILQEPVVFYFDESLYPASDAAYLSWVLPVIRTGVRVGVLTKEGAVKEGLRDLLKEAGYSEGPEGQFWVVSLDAFASHDLAQQELVRQLGGISLVHVPPDLSGMKRFFEDLGLIFPSGDLTIQLKKSETYLASLA